MDLRRSVLTKQNNVLCETSLNVSSTSAYDSAVDDSNTSLYYSFTNDSTSTLDSSVCNQQDNQDKNDENDFGNQSTSSDADKENTVIMRNKTSSVEGIEKVHEWEKNSVEAQKVETVELKGDVKMLEITDDHSLDPTKQIQESSVNPVKDVALKPQQDDKIFVSIEECSETTGKLGKGQATEKLPLIKEDDEFAESSEELSHATTKSRLTRESVDVAVTAKPLELTEIEKSSQDQEMSDLVPEMPPHLLSQVDSPCVNIREQIQEVVGIVIQDPNENIINPFTTIVEPPMIVIHPVVPEKRVTRRSIQSTRIPAKTGFYSPVLRKSLERKAKVTNKPPNTRRTLYGAMKVPTQTKPKTPTLIPKPSVLRPAVKPVTACKPLLKPAVKPKVYKCSEAGCLVEFSTARALQEHLKQHKEPTKALSNLICNYCDKKFQLEAALLNHQTEKCTRIPFNEKRKLLAQRDKKEKERRSTALFTMPAPKLKSPSRRQSTVPKLNKSGIIITPKKSLKCHICKFIVPDALSLANHILAHKFSKPANSNTEQA